MPTPLPPEMRVGIVEPKEAIAMFRQRKLLTKSFSWMDVYQEEHTQAFTVSRLAETRLLEFMRSELDKAAKEGTSLEAWSKTVQKRLEEAGWWGRKEVVDTVTGETVTTTFNPSRLQLIYEVNVGQSYDAGRWQRIERTKARFPFIMYNHRHGGRLLSNDRPEHVAWHGLVLPVDHPFWDTHYPRNGWRCYCTAFGLAQKDIDRRIAAGQKITTEAPKVEFREFVNKRTGEVTKVPKGIDPGFAYNPGKLRPVPQV